MVDLTSRDRIHQYTVQLILFQQYSVIQYVGCCWYSSEPPVTGIMGCGGGGQSHPSG